MAEKNSMAIKQCILQYLLNGDFQFRTNASSELYQRLESEIKKKIDGDDSSYLKFEEIFNELVMKKILVIESGTIKELGIPAIEYALNHNVFDQKFLIKKIFDIKESLLHTQIALVEQYEDMDKLKDDIDIKIKKHEDKINNFDKNILTIMSLLIGAFSIIGFNFDGITNIINSDRELEVWEYVGGIAICNFCIIFSLYFLLCLINKIVNKDNSECKNIKILSSHFNFFSFNLSLFFIVIIVVIILGCFIIA
ncbi:MAG TPA: hypothetical protein DDX68_12925 [Clostridium sp.]|nr:hypothetical protein [Clostridium sp.]